MKSVAKIVGFLIMFSQAQFAGAAEWKFGLARSLESKFVRVCLFRDKATAGFFSAGKWKASLDASPSEGCEETLGADLEKQVLYFVIPGFTGRGGYLANKADAYCPLNRAVNGYSPCSSSFFSSLSDAPNYKVLDYGAVGNIVEEAGLFASLDKLSAEKKVEAANRQHAEYLRAFQAATTLEAIQLFERDYSGKDPDGLIEKLAPKKEAFQRQRQREKFSSARSAKELSAFLSEFANNDLESLVPLAQGKLAEAELREAKEADATKKKAELDQLERQIRYCIDMTAKAQAAIDRENKIGAVSGYVDKSILRQAGEVIVMCRESTPKNFSEYRKKGGAKSLEAIGSGR